MVAWRLEEASEYPLRLRLQLKNMPGQQSYSPYLYLQFTDVDAAGSLLIFCSRQPWVSMDTCSCLYLGLNRAIEVEQDARSDRQRRQLPETRTGLELYCPRSCLNQANGV